MTAQAEAPTDGPLSPWDRAHDEGPEAWQAFGIFRDLGPQRSCEQVAREVGKGRALMLRWSRRHAWLARCEAWDDEMDRIRQAEHIEAVRSMSERHAKIAHSMLEKVVARLLTLDPETMTPHQLARFAVDAVSIERRALGESTSVDPPNNEQDEAVIASILEGAAQLLAERETAAFMEGAAAGAAVSTESDPVDAVHNA